MAAQSLNDGSGAVLPGGASQAGGEVDPRHVFLSAREVMARYRWSKTKGYQNLKNRELVPPPVVQNPDRWRLDHLLAWEDRRFRQAQKELTRSPRKTNTAAEETAGSDSGQDVDHRELERLFPQPKQNRSSKRRSA